MSNTVTLRALKRGRTIDRQLLPLISQWDIYSLCLPMLAILPLLCHEAVLLWAKPHMQFFPLAIFFASWFLFTEGDQDRSISRKRRALAYLVSFIAIMTGYIALIIYSPWLSHLAATLLIFSWGIGKFGSLSLSRLVGICSLILVTLTPPFDLDKELVHRLQGLSSELSSDILDALNNIHLKNGNLMETRCRTLFVEEACSGIDSQYALLAIAVTLLLAGKSGTIVSLITILTVPLWAIFGNILRIVLIVVLLDRFDVDLSLGWPHTLVGLVTFSFAAWAHWSSVQFLSFVSHRLFRIKADNGSSVNADSQVWPFPMNYPSSIKRWYLIYSGAMLLLTPTAFIGLAEQGLRVGIPRLTVSMIASLPSEDDLPSKAFGCTRSYFSSQIRNWDSLQGQGQQSRVWAYTANETEHIMSLDLPFRGWHPLWHCYESTGWTILRSNEVSRHEDGSEMDWPFFEFYLHNSSIGFAELRFALFDQNGLPYLSSESIGPNRQTFDWATKFMPSIFEQIHSLRTPVPPLTFQCQLFTIRKDSDSVSENQSTEGRAMFLDFRDRICRKSKPVLDLLKSSAVETQGVLSKVQDRS